MHVELRDGNALVERIILSLRQEEVWLQDYASFAEALVPVSSWILDYKRERPHQSLKYRKPVEVRQEAFGINAIRSLKCQPQDATLTTSLLHCPHNSGSALRQHDGGQNQGRPNRLKPRWWLMQYDSC